MSRSPISGYLQKHAEACVSEGLKFKGSWSHAVCIPACNEEISILNTIRSIQSADHSSNALLILIVNGAEDASDTVHRTNELFLDSLHREWGTSPGPASLAEVDPLNVLILDHASPGRRLPARQGVGLARKIASDLALALYHRGDLASPWMLCTDADVVVPRDYFTALPEDSARLSAALFPFEHTLEGSHSQQQAMLSYESYLHYYMLGLRWAGSPYATHTIGSLFAIHAEHYAAVRGFPKRMAGEDFYLLNKLAKVAPILPLQCGRIHIRGRLSDRVPFGTGAALSQIQVLDTEYTVYDPRIFKALQLWTAALHHFAQTPDLPHLQASIETESPLPDGLLSRCLEEMGALQAAAKAMENSKPGRNLQRRLLEWNDAFRTLKLVHALRDGGLPSIPLNQALGESPFLQGYQPVNAQVDLAFLQTQAEALAGHPVGIDS